MSELVITPEVLQMPKNAEQAYLQILGLDYLPKSPYELPLKVTIPTEVLGNFEQSILETTTDGLERSQIIGYDNNQGIIPDNTLVGYAHTLGERAMLFFKVRALFGKKSLLFYHTHAGKNSPFSRADIAIFKYFQRGAFIFLVGFQDGAEVLLQAGKAAKMPISSGHLAKELEDRIKKDLGGVIGSMKKDPKDPKGKLLVAPTNLTNDYRTILAKIGYDFGYGYYHCSFPSGSLKPGDLKEGLKLTRVTPRF